MNTTKDSTIDHIETSDAIKKLGIPLWCTEEYTVPGDWRYGLWFARLCSKYYVKAEVTKIEAWPLLGALYSYCGYSNAGFMLANQPWSGFYELTPALWCVAHYTQFIEPGWVYLKGGCGTVGNWGYYTTLKKPDASGDYSTIIANGTVANTYTINLSGGLSTGTVHVWKSDSARQFIKQADITPVNASYSLSAAANSIYSLTTTTGQQKGVAATAIPSAKSFPFPYTDNFESYEIGVTPKYFHDGDGTFETSLRPGGNGKALRQMMNTYGLGVWGTKGSPPYSVLGQNFPGDYMTSVDAYIQDSGYVELSGKSSGNWNWTAGYRIRITNKGTWALKKDSITLKSGSASVSANTWHNLKLTFEGSTIKGYIDNVNVVTATDASYKWGVVALGTGLNIAYFDNFVVGPPNYVVPVTTATAGARPMQKAPQTFFVSGTSRFSLPGWRPGRVFSVAIYDFSGKCIQHFSTDRPAVCLKKLPQGVYIARVRAVR